MRASARALADVATRRPWAASAALAALVFGLTLLCFTPVWQENDDALMAMIAAGDGFALQPDPHLVFSSTLVGRPLAALYRHWPGAPWYGLHLLLLLLAAQTALVRAALAGPQAARRAGAALLVLGTTGLHFVLALQFSTTAFLACVAGLTLACSTAGQADPRPSSGALALAGLLLAGGWLVRHESFWLALAGSVPALAALWSEARDRRRALARALLLALAPVLLAVALDRGADDGSEAWREYRRFLREMAVLVNLRGLAYTPETAPAFAEAGWSPNDLLLFRSWFFPDAVLFSTENVERLNREEAASGFRRLATPPVEALRRALLRASLAPLALALPWLLWSGSGGRRSRLALAATGAAAMAGVYVAAALGHAPERLMAIFLTFPAAAALLLGGGDPPSRRRAPALLVLLALTGVVLGLAQQLRRGAEARRRNAALRSSLERLPAAPRLYVVWAGGFPYEAMLPLEDRGYLKRFRLLTLGWPQRTPIADRMLQSFGIDDLFTALHSRDDVRLIGVPSMGAALTTFGREHRGLEVSFELEERLPALRVYRARAVRGPA